MIIQNTKDKIARTEHTDDELFSEPIEMKNQDIYHINFDTELHVMNKLASRNLIEDVLKLILCLHNHSLSPGP